MLKIYLFPTWPKKFLFTRYLILWEAMILKKMNDGGCRESLATTVHPDEKMHILFMNLQVN